jgi:hypothetical protein
MDKTLMRPLFRDKATQLNQPRKIDGSKVPKYAIGAAIQLGRAGLAGLGRVAQPAYQYLKTKAATPTGQKVLTGLEGAGVYMGAGDVVEVSLKETTTKH